MSVTPENTKNNQGVPSEEEIKKAEAEKAQAEAEQARKEKESKEAQERTKKDAAEKKKEAAAAKKAEEEVSAEDVASVRTVGWEKEQARREKELEETSGQIAPARVEEFKGHKLEDRLANPEYLEGDSEEAVAKKATNKK